MVTHRTNVKKVFLSVFGALILGVITLLPAQFSSRAQVTMPESIFSSAGYSARDLSVPLSDEVYIPAGTFMMGCSEDTAGDKLCAYDAQPIHAVYLDAYTIEKTEVSNAQYADCVAAGGCVPPISNSSSIRLHYYDDPAYAHYPVVQMDWDRANAYCQWVGKRLPTEAEWEKAARGDDLRPFPWGFDDMTCNRCNCNIRYYNELGETREHLCVGDTVPVESYHDSASPYGVLNMVGNAQEWVNDIYLKPYYSRSPYFNPQGPESTQANEHLIRGGSWKGVLTHANTWVRLDEADIYYEEMNGFRCVRTVSEGTPTPTPVPIPSPTPIPVASVNINADGGVTWLAYPGHLTVAKIPENAVSDQTLVTLTYALRPNVQGVYQGMDHFFKVEAGTGDVSLGANQAPFPMEILLAYQSRDGIISDTLHLYRYDAGVWVTTGLTLTERLGNGFMGVVDGPGLYGLLGKTHRTYLPNVLRAH